MILQQRRQERNIDKDWQAVDDFFCSENGSVLRELPQIIVPGAKFDVDAIRDTEYGMPVASLASGPMSQPMSGIPEITLPSPWNQLPCQEFAPRRRFRSLPAT